MHNTFPNKFYFINGFKKNNIDKLNINTGVIFRNYTKKVSIYEIIQTKKLPIVITVSGYVTSIDEFRENILRRNKSTPIIVEGIGKKLDLPLVDTSRAESIGFNPFFDLSTSIDDYISEKGINV